MRYVPGSPAGGAHRTLRELGWFRAGYDGSQDYDLALRLAARTAAIRHIPQVLYHWRQHPDSTAQHAAAKPYTQAAGLKALSEAAARFDAQAVVTAGAFPNTYRVRWPVPANAKASLIICSRNAKLLKRCLEAVEKHTTHTQQGDCDCAAPRRRHCGDGSASQYLRLRARAVYRAI